MRRRLLAVLLLFSLLAVTGFAVPLLFSTAAERTQRWELDRSGDLERFADLARRAEGADRSALVDEIRSYVGLYGESVLVVDGRGGAVAGAGGLRADDPGLRGLIDGALRNESGQRGPQLRPWSTATAVLTRPIGDGTTVTGAVLLQASRAVAADDIARRWAIIAGGSAVAAVTFVLLALLVSRWVLRPLARLAHGVRRVTDGNTGECLPADSGPGELRALTVSFNRMVSAVREAAEHQRRLIADASHQLRNPMAALRLRVDALAASVPASSGPTYESVLGEVERMETLLDGLLAMAIAESDAGQPLDPRGASCDVAAVLAERVDVWRPVVASRGVELVHSDTAHGVVAGYLESELAQVLDVLVDNASHYGARRVTLRLWGVGGQVVLEVGDDGPGLSRQERSLATERFWRGSTARGRSGSGLGLSIARRLIERRGGVFALRPAVPTGLTVLLTLPGPPEPESVECPRPS